MAKTLGISKALGDLFRAPLDAVTDAERDYLAIWSQWLDMQLKLIGDKELTLEQIEKLLNKAPSVKLDGFVDVGISMRIATVSQFDVGVGVGANLGVAPVHVSGSFGFSRTSSNESMFQASARFAVSNHNSELAGFLKDMGEMPKTTSELSGVSDKLHGWLKDMTPEIPA